MTYVRPGERGEVGYFRLALDLCVDEDEIEAFARTLDETGLLGGGDVLRNELADIIDGHYVCHECGKVGTIEDLIPRGGGPCPDEDCQGTCVPVWTGDS